MPKYALPSESEERLVAESIQAKDDAAFELLYRKYAPAVRDFCRDRLGDRTDAEDACHQAMLRTHDAFYRFKPGARIWPWLATIAANVCNDIHSRRSRSAYLDTSVERTMKGLDEEVARRANIQIVVDSLRALSQPYRSHIYRRYYEGWSYERIARFYGTSENAVRSLLYRARHSLKEEIKKTAKARRQWPLPAFLPGILRYRSTLAERKYSMSESSFRVWRVALSGATESINALIPVLSNAAIAAVLLIAGIDGVGGTPAAAAAETPDRPSLSSAVAVPADVPAVAPDTSIAAAATSATVRRAQSEAPADPPSTPATEAEEPAESQPNAPISVMVAMEPQSSTEDAGTVSSPAASASADANTSNGDGERAWLDIAPRQVECPPPENRGIVTEIVCPALEQQLS